MKKINNVAIVGMGALGMLYGSMITDTLGIESVTYILDDDRFDRYKERTFTVNGAPFHPQFEKANDAKPYDLVIVAVKYNGLDSALDTMKNCIGPDTIIMSVMNGMISEEIIAQRYGMENIVYTVVQGMDAQHSEGTLGYTQKGVVCIGPAKGQTRDNTDAVADFLTRANVAHQVEENILYRMFCKWMLNVGVNQTCMVFDASYNECLTIPEAYDVLCKSMREVIALSPHFDLNLGEEEFEFYMQIIRNMNPDGFPSMEQDRRAKRLSEVEMFAGSVIKYGEKYGVDVPVNKWLYEEVKKIEAGY